MSSRHRLDLDASNSRLYVSHPGAARCARIRGDGAEYTLRWGRQWFDGPHVEVLDPAGSYGVSLHSFFSTHAPLPQRPDHYVKVARVRAMQTREAMTLETWVDGRLEMRVEVPARAFVVQNPGGEQYAMSADEFGCRYRPAE